MAAPPASVKAVADAVEARLTEVLDAETARWTALTPDLEWPLDALRRLVQIADRTLAADRAVIAMRGAGADPCRQQLLRIAVAPAQEIDNVERLDLVKQLCAGIGLGALQRLLQQGEGFEARGDLLRPVDDFADADDDGNTICGKGLIGHLIFLLSIAALSSSLRGAKRRPVYARCASYAGLGVRRSSESEGGSNPAFSAAAKKGGWIASLRSQ